MAKHQTIQIVLTLAISHYWSIKQLDVHNAFLNDDLLEEVLPQPPGFEYSFQPRHVCRLKKAIYGLK